VPAVPSCILEPLWDQFQALLAARSVSHPLGCHRPRVPDRVIFDKLIQVLVFGCGDRRIAGQGCSATTLRRRRDEWIALRLAEHLHQLALHAYDRLLAWSWTTWPLTAASQGALRRPGRRAKPGGSPQAGPSLATEAHGLPLAAVPAPANRRDDRLLAATLDRAAGSSPLRSARYLRIRWCSWTPATTTSPAARFWPTVRSPARSPPAASQPRSRPGAAGRSNAPMPGPTSTASCAGAPSAAKSWSSLVAPGDADRDWPAHPPRLDQLPLGRPPLPAPMTTYWGRLEG
jgi:hypothetical protein